MTGRSVVIVCLLAASCHGSRRTEADAIPSPVGTWEFSERGERVVLALEAAGTARLTIGDEEVLGNREEVVTRYRLEPKGPHQVLHLMVSRFGVQVLDLAMLVRLAKDEMTVRTFFNEQAPDDFGGEGDEMTRVLRRVESRVATSGGAR